MDGPALAPVPLAAPAIENAGLRAALLDAAARVIDRGAYVLGPEVEAFEAEMAAHLGVESVIDLLSLDVEGAEVEVLKGIDHSAYRFRHMLIECRDSERLARFLDPLGYRLAERFNAYDCLFVPSGEG